MSGKGEGGQRLLFVVNAGCFFRSHRLPVALAARDAGFEVHVATHADAGDEAALGREGIAVHNVPLERGKLSIWSDLRYFVRLMGVMKRVHPDIVHNVTVKPVLYGTIAARLLGVKGIVNALAGLGYSFARDSRRILAAALTLAFRVAFRGRGVVLILQNADDMRLMKSMRVIAPERMVLIRGSGVNLTEYRLTQEPANLDPLVLLPARVLRDKGVHEFAEASGLLAARNCRARFVIAGPLDSSNPAALTQEELDQLLRRYPVTWLGYVEDMGALYRQASIVCLPSYREGLPKALLEACAVGRAIVTTDVPGCREVVQHDVNGLLVPAGNAEALAGALQSLICDPQRRARLGSAGRRLAEERYGVERVIAQTIALYGRISGAQRLAPPAHPCDQSVRGP